MSLAKANCDLLLDIARRSIQHGLKANEPLKVKAAELPAELQPIRATFVTLEIEGRLRGCIGTLEAHLPLAEDVAIHAYEAAFHDPRFPPLSAGELSGLDIHISILSPPLPIPCKSESELVGQLKPGEDGLILQEGPHRATFLPSVWDDLKDPQDFVTHLKMKGGWGLHYWSDDMRAFRYRSEYISQPKA